MEEIQSKVNMLHKRIEDRTSTWLNVAQRSKGQRLITSRLDRKKLWNESGQYWNNQAFGVELQWLLLKLPQSPNNTDVAWQPQKFSVIVMFLKCYDTYGIFT